MSWVIVLGMHRSGTSALAGELSHQGVHFGNDFIESIESVNKKGFFEHKELVAINEALLEEMGHTWFDCFAIHSKLSDGWQPSKSLLDRMYALINSDEFDGHQICGLKDPRLSVLLPLWLNIFQTLNIRPRFALVNRNVDEIAASLKKRDEMHGYHASILWHYYTVFASVYTQGYSRSWTETEALFTSPKQELNKIVSALNLDVIVNDIYFIDPSIPSQRNQASFYPFYQQLMSVAEPLVDIDWNQQSQQLNTLLTKDEDKLKVVIESFYTINRLATELIKSGERYTHALTVIEQKDLGVAELTELYQHAVAVIQEREATINLYEKYTLIKYIKAFKQRIL